MNIILFMLGFALKANTQRRLKMCNAALPTAKFISSFDPASTIITRVKGKAVISAPSKMSPGVKCFHYHGLGHVQSQCPKLALLIEQDDLEEVGPHDVQFDSPEDNDDGLDLDDEDEQFLGVVRCILTKPTSEDWRRTANYTTYMKCGQAFYRVIIDSGSAINAVSSKPVSQLKLTPQPHHCPYKVSCVNKTSLPVTQRCLLPLEVL